MDITELEMRELTSLRDKLRHRLRMQLRAFEEGNATDTDKQIFRVRVDTFRESIGDAYRKRELYLMRAYFNYPNIIDESNLNYSVVSYIDLAYTALKENDAITAMQQLSEEHVAAYRRFVLVLTEIDRRRYQYDGVKQRAAIAFVLSDLAHEEVITSIIRSRDTLELDLISDLLTESKKGALALHEGVL